MQFSTKCWSEHILSAHKATKDLKLPLYMTFNVLIIKMEEERRLLIYRLNCGFLQFKQIRKATTFSSNKTMFGQEDKK